MGLGTQDDMDQANEFVDRFELTHTMLWDESYESWAQLGVALQPSAQLFAADGTRLGSWLGPFDDEEVLALVAGSRSAATSQVASSGQFCRFVDRFARAQVDAGGYVNASSDGRGRILDDLRFAANASEQTAPPDLHTAVTDLAAAVRAHAQTLIDAGLPDDPGAATTATRPVLVSALDSVREPLREACGTGLGAEATP